MKQVVLILTLALFAFTTTNAQTKVAHINSSELLELMPEAKQITADLEKEQQEWQSVLANKEKEIQAKYEAYRKAETEGTTSEAMMEVMKAEIEGLQGQYQQTQQTASKALQKKQQEMLEPLLEKVKTAISDVAKENGYDYVMDATDGSGIIYSNPKNDLLPLVKTKLGIL